MRKEILAIILVLLVPWELNRRNTVIQSPEVHHVDQEEGEGIVEPTQKPAEIPLIFKILYPWAVSRDVVKGVPETPMQEPRNVIVGAPETEEEIVKTTPQPAKIPLIFRILYPWAVPRDVVRGVPETPMQEPRNVIVGSPETEEEIVETTPQPAKIPLIFRILPLLINAGDWYQWVITGLWSVWSNGCVALENTVQPVLINIVTEHRLECFMGLIIVLVSVLLGYFEPIYRLLRPTSSYFTPPTSENEESTMEETPFTIPGVAPTRSNTKPCSDEVLATNYRTPEMDSDLRSRWKTSSVDPSGARPSENVDSSMEETDVPFSSVAPPQASHSASLSQHIEKLESEMVVEHRDLFLQKSDIIIPPTSKNAASAMETDVSIPSVTPTRNNTKPWSSEILATTPAMDSSLGPQWRTFFVHPSIVRRRKNVDSSMEETGVPIPSVTPPQAFHSASLSQHIEKLIVHPRVACRGKNVDSSMEETVPVPSVTPPRASLRAKLSRHIRKLKSKMVIRNIFPRKSDITPPSNIIPPTSKNAASAMEETDAPIPSVVPTRTNTKPRSDESLPTNYRTPEMDSGLSPQWRTVIVHPRVARHRENVDSSMEETDVSIPSVTSPRGLSNVAPQNGGRLSLPSSLMSPVTDDINMLLDSSISQQRATLAVVPNVETRSNQTRLHLRELFRLVKKRKATKEDRQES